MGELFLSAEDGAIVLRYEGPDFSDIAGHRGGPITTTRAWEPVDVADALHVLGAVAPSRVQHSSSMDFASEFGFNTDRDAWAIYNAGVSIYNIKYGRN